MALTTVSIKFKDTGLGQASVSILGPNDFTDDYNINGDDSRNLDLEDGDYDIEVDGDSQTTATLSITDEKGASLLADGGGPGRFVIDDLFTVGN
jgi:hypothetical protein